MKYKQKFVALNPYEEKILHQLAGKYQGNILRISMHFAYNHKMVVYRVKNRINKRVFYGMEESLRFYEKDVMIEISDKYTIIMHDIVQYGRMAFEVENCGAFSTILEAHEYMEFLLNKSHSEGEILYNSELHNGIYQKYIIIPIPMKLHHQLVNFLFEKRKTLNSVVISFLKGYLKRRKKNN